MKAVKLVLVGEEVTGKAQLARDYAVGGIEEDLTNPGLSNNFSRTLEINGQSIICHLVVTDASAESDKLRPLSYPQTDLFLVLYSAVNPSSFDRMKSKWIPEIKLNSPDTPFYIVGTHAEEREGQKGIALDVVNALCKETGGQGAIECSFVSHVGVDTVFETALSFLTEPHIVPPLALTPKSSGKKPGFLHKHLKPKTPREGSNKDSSKDISNTSDGKNREYAISTPSAVVNINNASPRKEKKKSGLKSKGSSPSLDLRDLKRLSGDQGEKQIYSELVSELMAARDEITDLKEELALKDSLIGRLEKEVAELRRLCEGKQPTIHQLPNKEWSANEMYDYLRVHPLLKSVAKQFRNEEIDGAAFFKLGDQDFDSLCLKIGTRKVIEQLIEDANNHSS